MLELNPDSIPARMTSADAIAIRAAESPRLMLVFTGLGRRAGISLRMFYDYVAPHNVNVIFLADDHEALYLRGIKSFGLDLPETFGRIRKIMCAWKIEDTVCFGSSAGGYGALLYGANLNARRMMVVSPLTNGTPGSDRRIESFAMDKTLGEIAKERSVDLRDTLAGFVNLPRSDCYYATDSKVDETQARNLDGLDNVFLHPLKQGGHAVILALHRSGMLKSMFDNLYQ